MARDFDDILPLLKRISNGDQDAFRQLFNLLEQKVYSFAIAITRSEYLAEEVTQKIFIKIWNNRRILPEVKEFSAWLSVVVKNESYTTLKQIAREKEVLQKYHKREMVHTVSAKHSLEERENRRLLNRAIEKLPPQQKKVYLLSRHQGLRHAAIARELDLSVFTVKNHIKAALRSIRIYMEANLTSFLFICFSYHLLP